MALSTPFGPETSSGPANFSWFCIIFVFIQLDTYLCKMKSVFFHCQMKSAFLYMVGIWKKQKRGSSQPKSNYVGTDGVFNHIIESYVATATGAKPPSAPRGARLDRIEHSISISVSSITSATTTTTPTTTTCEKIGKIYFQ